MRHIKQHSKITFFLLLLLTQSLFSAALSNMIKEKKWDLLQKMMTQEHLSDLKNKFSQYQKLKLIPLRVGVIKYYIKKKNRGEIGFIEYKREKHRFSELKLRENFTDLRFINLFEKISIKNVAIQISDATLTFLSGDLFIAKPLNRLVIFRGSMSLDILPNDLEEQRTLIQLYKKKPSP